MPTETTRQGSGELLPSAALRQGSNSGGRNEHRRPRIDHRLSIGSPEWRLCAVDSVAGRLTVAPRTERIGLALNNRYSDWLPPEFIIGNTPIRVRAPLVLPAVLAALIVIVLNLAMAALLFQLWRSLVAVAVISFGTAAASSYRCFRPIAQFIQAARVSLPLEHMRQSMIACSSCSRSAMQVRGLEPGAWVQLKADHEEKRRDLRGGAARLAQEPQVDFRLCVARFRINGNHH